MSDLDEGIASIEKLLSRPVHAGTLMASKSSKDASSVLSGSSARRRVSLDARSLSSESTSYLYKYGHEVSAMPSVLSQPSAMRSLPSSIASLGGTASIEALPEVIDRPASSKRVVCGAQFRLLASNKLAHRCDGCDTWERTHRKDKEIIRSLRLQIARLEESWKDLKYTKTDPLPTPHGAHGGHGSAHGGHGGGHGGSASSEAPDDLTDDPEILHRIQLLEDDLTKHKRLLANERATSEALRGGLADLRASAATDTQRLSKEISSLTSELTVVRIQYNKLTVDNDSTVIKLNDCERELIYAQKRLQDALLRLQAASERLKGHEENIDTLRDLARLRGELESATDHVRHLEHTLSTRSQALTAADESIALLTAQLHSTESVRDAMAVEIADLQAQLRAANDTSAIAKKRCEALEGSLKVTIQERDGYKSALSDQSNELQAAKNKIGGLEGDLSTVQGKLNDTLRRVTLESVNTKKALEKAVTTSVRLCVVAPTVNVNVSDAKNKFKSRLSEKALSAFLHAEVFDKYSFLFKQEAENASPNGEGSMEVWLQRMLAQMQTTIESHVNSAMDGSSLG